MTEPRIPRIRKAALPDDAVLVVRGDAVDRFTARHQAEVFRRRFPGWQRWGLSAFYARSVAEIDDLGADQLERFPLLGCFLVADLAALGFEIWPTFRTPHVTAFRGELDERVATLVRAVHELRHNPYHQPEPEVEQWRSQRSI